MKCEICESGYAKQLMHYIDDEYAEDNTLCDDCLSEVWKVIERTESNEDFIERS